MRQMVNEYFKSSNNSKSVKQYQWSQSVFIQSYCLHDLPAYKIKIIFTAHKIPQTPKTIFQVKQASKVKKNLRSNKMTFALAMEVVSASVSTCTQATSPEAVTFMRGEDTWLINCVQ